MAVLLPCCYQQSPICPCILHVQTHSCQAHSPILPRKRQRSPCPYPTDTSTKAMRHCPSSIVTLLQGYSGFLVCSFLQASLFQFPSHYAGPVAVSLWSFSLRPRSSSREQRALSQQVAREHVHRNSAAPGDSYGKHRVSNSRLHSRHDDHNLNASNDHTLLQS